MTEPKNLLIVRTDRIGDVVLSLPLAAIIKKYYPDCKVTFLLREYTKSLAEGNPYIDEILLLKTSGNKILIRGNAEKLYSKQFDAAIIVYPTFILSLILFLSRIKLRVGTGYRWYSLLFNRKVYEHRKHADKHELEYNIRLLQEIGIKKIEEAEKSNFSIQVSDTSMNRVVEVLKNKGIDSKDNLVIVHPGSGGSSVDLPIEKFRELVKLLSRRDGWKILVTGNIAEHSKCESLVLNGNIKNFAGIFNLGELIALIDLTRLFISNSTGPLHIAAALGKYTIGFYPKVPACSANRWGPYTRKKLIFTPEMECKNCTVEQCIKLNCMNSIDINKVFEKIEKILMLLPNTGETDV